MDFNQARALVRSYENKEKELDRLRRDCDELENDISNQETNYNEAKCFVSECKQELDQFIENKNNGILKCSEKTMEAIKTARATL